MNAISYSIVPDHVWLIKQECELCTETFRAADVVWAHFCRPEIMARPGMFEHPMHDGCYRKIIQFVVGVNRDYAANPRLQHYKRAMVCHFCGMAALTIPGDPPGTT